MTSARSFLIFVASYQKENKIRVKSLFMNFDLKNLNKKLLLQKFSPLPLILDTLIWVPISSKSKYPPNNNWNIFISFSINHFWIGTLATDGHQTLKCPLDTLSRGQRGSSPISGANRGPTLYPPPNTIKSLHLSQFLHHERPRHHSWALQLQLW